MEFLRLNNIEKSYGKVQVIKEISIAINEGEFVCLLGPSGCGKTTLLRIIAGLEDEHKGKVYIKNIDATDFGPEKRNFGIVFQSYALFPNMTVFKNISFGLENQKMNKKDINKKVAEVVSLVELGGKENKYPSQLSGGEQQRVALARAIVLSPDFLLLDEPLSALDAKVREKLRVEIRMLQKKLGITTIMVTHDQEEALTMADKIIVMNKGEIMQVGTPQQIYDNPENTFVGSFIGTINLIEDENNVRAIRPEEIEINLLNRNGLIGEIINLEYKGSHYVVTVKHKNEYIKMNVSSQILNENKLKEGCKISFNIGTGRVVNKVNEDCA